MLYTAVYVSPCRRADRASLVSVPRLQTDSWPAGVGQVKPHTRAPKQHDSFQHQLRDFPARPEVRFAIPCTALFERCAPTSHAPSVVV